MGYEHLPDLPDHCAADADEARLRRLRALEGPSWGVGIAPAASAQPAEQMPAGALATVSADAWLMLWHERLGCWFLALAGPTRTQLRNCIGALGIHVAARLEAAMHDTSAALGGAAVSQPPADAANRGATAAHCKWLDATGVLRLPEFPPLSWLEDSRRVLALPPIPKLLPAWQQLQGLVERHLATAPQPHALATHLPRKHTRSFLAFTFGLALGACLGAVKCFGRHLMRFGRRTHTVPSVFHGHPSRRLCRR